MATHIPGCAGGHCLCDVPRYKRGLLLSALASATGVAGILGSGGSIAVLAITLHAIADGGVYALGIAVAYRCNINPAAARTWQRLSAWVNAILMFVFAYHVAAETIERFGSGEEPLRGGWMVFAGLSGAALNLLQHAVVAKGEGHSVNRVLNLHNLGDVAEGVVVATTGVLVAAAPVFDLAASGLLVLWFMYLGTAMVLGHEGHHHH